MGGAGANGAGRGANGRGSSAGVSVRRKRHSPQRQVSDFFFRWAVAGGGSIDRSLKVWDVVTGRELATLPNNNELTSMVFLPGSDIIAANTENGTVELWDVPSGQQVGQPLPCSQRPLPCLSQSTNKLQACFASTGKWR